MSKFRCVPSKNAASNGIKEFIVKAESDELCNLIEAELRKQSPWKRHVCVWMIRHSVEEDGVITFSAKFATDTSKAVKGFIRCTKIKPEPIFIKMKRWFDPIILFFGKLF